MTTTQFLADVERDDRPPPIPSQTDVVVDGIKSMIIRGQLGPGARLPREKDLARELNEELPALMMELSA